MRKLSTLILASFILALPLSAFAVRQVPGNVPNTTPLQPVPVDSAPNISRNIKDSSPAAGGQTNSTSELGNLDAVESAVPGAEQSTRGRLAENAGNPAVIIIIIIALALAAAGIVIWLRKRKHVKEHVKGAL